MKLAACLLCCVVMIGSGIWIGSVRDHYWVDRWYAEHDEFHLVKGYVVYEDTLHGYTVISWCSPLDVSPCLLDAATVRKVGP